MMETEKMANHEFFRRLAVAKANGYPMVTFTVSVHLPKSDPCRKTGKFLSLSEICKTVGIKPTTYRRYEGSLFLKAKRLHNDYRVFTNEDAEILRKIWSGRA
jgi:hypothetical protein